MKYLMLRPSLLLIVFALALVCALSVKPGSADTKTSTTTEANGNTITTIVTSSEKATAEGTYRQDSDTVVVVRDPHGNILSRTITGSTTWFDKKGKQIRRVVIKEKRKYNAAGGYAEEHMVSDVNNVTGETEDTVYTCECDAAGNRLSGEKTETKSAPGGKKTVNKSRWNPQKANWEVALAGDPGLGGDKHFTRAPAQPQNGNGVEQGTYLPPLAGPRSEIVGTVSTEQAGPTGFFVATVTDTGATQYYRGKTDGRGHFHLRLPNLTGLAKLLLFREFDRSGRPDQGATCQISSKPIHLENTEPVLNVPRTGPAIIEANTAYERGGFGQGLVQLHTRGTDALSSQVLVDGSSRDVDTLAASDSSLVGKLHDNVGLGRHRIGAKSGSEHTNEQPADVVTEHFDPIGTLHSGQVVPVRLHIDGLGKDPARVRFTVGGAATVAEGSNTATVPVVNDTAEVNIRAREVGQLLIRTILLVEIPEILSKLPDGLKLKVTPTPTEAPTPTPYPIESPHIPGHIPPSCHPRADGYFEPSQGVWQDDSVFDDHPTKQITRPNRDVPHYNAELDMITHRDTLLFGVEHYRDQNGAEVSAFGHEYIRMNVVSDCSDPPKGVFMRFTLERGASPPGRLIYSSPVLAKIPLTGHHVEPEKYYTVLLDSKLGVPPPPNPPFRIAAFGEYLIKDELYTDDNKATGLAVTVGGNIHGTASIKVAFLAAYFLPTLSSAARKLLDDNSEKLGTEFGKYAPDYYPMPPRGIEGWALDPIDLTTTNVLNPTMEKKTGPEVTAEEIAFDERLTKSQRIRAEMARQLDALARTAGYQRFVVVLSVPDFEAAIGSGMSGYIATKKLAYVEYDVNYFTVMHEIAHSLPYIWTDFQMTRDCSRPGNYHNEIVDWANGVRIVTAGVPGERKIFHRAYTIMGGQPSEKRDPAKTWIAQCTYWNLANALRKKPDPPALLVRGLVSRAGGKAGAMLWSSYDIDGVIDEQSRPARTGENWAVVYRVGGRMLATFPFEPQWRDENGVQQDVVSFSMQLPRLSGLVAVELRGPNGFVLSHAVSLKPPAVRISPPVVNGASAVLSWNASVQTGFPKLSTVLYSNDGGRSYHPRVFEQPMTSATIKIDPAAHRHRIKIIVTDGSQSAERTLDFNT